MPTPTNIQSELERHRSSNNDRLKDLMEQQYNMEATRAFELLFSASTQSDAEGLGRLLFAKGMRLLDPVPVHERNGGFTVRVAVKHNLREIAQEDFICDLIMMASGVHGIYERWELLPGDTAEESQSHNNAPGVAQ